MHQSLPEAVKASPQEPDAPRESLAQQKALSPQEPVSLQEFVHCGGADLRVDVAAGVIRGVKLLGLESRNGRTYLPAALRQAMPLYEGAKVNVNHPRGGPLAPRDYQDRIGQVRGVTLRDEGLFGDFHYNPRHALAEQLAWDARHAPENVGFSHNVEARTVRRGDRTVVEAIVQVQSVDLVADPATTRGLFEGRVHGPNGTGGTPVAPGDWPRIDEQAHVPNGTGETPVARAQAHGLTDEQAPAEAAVSEAADELARLRAQVERLAALVEGIARRSAAETARPQSREQALAENIFAPLSPRDFARLIR
jgi:hypothetical protein